MKWVDLFVGVDVSQTMPVVSTACAMIQCKISGAPIMEGDIQHFSLVKCQGMEGNCSLLVHPCCTITGVTCAHAFCCRHVLHDESLKNRLYLCDGCAATVLCKKPYSFASRGKWV